MPLTLSDLQGILTPVRPVQYADFSNLAENELKAQQVSIQRGQLGAEQDKIAAQEREAKATEAGRSDRAAQSMGLKRDRLGLDQKKLDTELATAHQAKVAAAQKLLFDAQDRNDESGIAYANKVLSDLQGASTGGETAGFSSVPKPGDTTAPPAPPPPSAGPGLGALAGRPPVAPAAPPPSPVDQFSSPAAPLDVAGPPSPGAVPPLPPPQGAAPPSSIGLGQLAGPPRPPVPGSNGVTLEEGQAPPPADIPMAASFMAPETSGAVTSGMAQARPGPQGMPPVPPSPEPGPTVPPGGVTAGLSQLGRNQPPMAPTEQLPGPGGAVTAGMAQQGRNPPPPPAPGQDEPTAPVRTAQQPPADTTQLQPQEEAAFQAWGKANGIADLNDPRSHYDYRGFWKQTGGAPVVQGAHFPDTFKQHGHPTFSVESQYSKGPGDGGTWSGEQFRPPAPGPGIGAIAGAPPAPSAGGAEQQIRNDFEPLIKAARTPEEKRRAQLASDMALSIVHREGVEKAREAGMKVYSGEQQNDRKTRVGTGKGVGEAGYGGTGLSKAGYAVNQDDREQYNNNVKAVTARHGINTEVMKADSALGAVESAINSKTGTGQLAAVTKALKAMGNTGAMSDKDLDRIMGSSGLWNQFKNIVSKYSEGNLPPELIQNLKGMVTQLRGSVKAARTAAAEDARDTMLNDPFLHGDKGALGEAAYGIFAGYPSGGSGGGEKAPKTGGKATQGAKPKKSVEDLLR